MLADSKRERQIYQQFGFADTASKLEIGGIATVRAQFAYYTLLTCRCRHEGAAVSTFPVNLSPRTLGGANAERQLDLNPYNSAQLDAWGEWGISCFVLSCTHVLGRIEVEWLER